MSTNELSRNSVAGDQSGVQLLPGVGVASAESAVISRSLLVVIDGAVQIRHYGKPSVSHQKFAVLVSIWCCPKPRFSVSVQKP